MLQDTYGLIKIRRGREKKKKREEEEKEERETKKKKNYILFCPACFRLQSTASVYFSRSL